MHLAVQLLFNLRHHRAAHRRVLLLTDPRTGVDQTEVVRLLEPWSMPLSAAAQIAAPVPSGALVGLATTCDVIAVLSTDAALVASVRDEAASHQLPVVTCSTPEGDTREAGLFEELAFHDRQLAGRDAQTGAHAEYASVVVTHLSAASCSALFPHYVLPFLGRTIGQQHGNPIAAVDLGCGPMSALRWGALHGLMSVTGIDPLLDMYSVLLNRHGYAALPAVRCAREIASGAETISDYIGPDSLDFVFSRNALDHAVDPPRIIFEAARCLRSGGVMAIEVFTREGSREKWWALHQHDMYLDARHRFLCESQDGSIRPMVASDSGLHLQQVVASTPRTTAVVFQKN